MRLIVSEKNIAASRIAEILAVGKPKKDKVYSTPVYNFRRDGEDWVSIGLKGHIMKVDFPKEIEHDGKTVDLSNWDLDTLDCLVRTPIEKVPTEAGIIRSIKNLAKKADAVVIATDFDREGELIGSDARNVVREVAPDVEISRARFSAITKGEIERAFSELGEISEDLAQAGETRQDIDLVWGATLTRFLTMSTNKSRAQAYQNVLSAGRVQTPTLKLIVDREKERQAFTPEAYWTVKGAFRRDGDEFTGSHVEERFTSGEAAKAAMDAVSDAGTGTVTGIKRTKRTVKPPAPFNTTSLMAAASAEGMTPAQTMRVAEGLYMSGLISYPRVDNTVYPSSLDFNAILKTLSGSPLYSETVGKIKAAGPLKPTRGKKEATDHPPIHPTGLGDPDKLDGQKWKIYNLIARRFMATLSDAALFEATRLDIDVAGQGFFAKGDVVVRPGFRAIYPYGMKKSQQLPSVSEGDVVDFLGADFQAKETQPPARYSSGKLIQEMEKCGLGTKATRHNIIQTLYDRKYTQDEPIEPTLKGIATVEALSRHVQRITTPDMTAELESDMDAIADAKADSATVVEHSRELLAQVMKELAPRSEELGEELRKATDADATVGVCHKCGSDLRIRYSKKTKQRFVGCSGWPECDVTYPLPRARIDALDEPCAECGAPRVRMIQKGQKPRERCLDPACPTNHEPEVVIAKCHTGDGGDLTVRRSHRTLKRFVRCTNYDECGVSYPLPQWGEVEPTEDRCEACGAPVVVVHTAKGPWRICVDPACPTKKNRKKKSRKKSPTKKGGKK